jgi:hypothetical protein
VQEADRADQAIWLIVRRKRRNARPKNSDHGHAVKALGFVHEVGRDEDGDAVLRDALGKPV